MTELTTAPHWATMTAPQLVAFYNRHAEKPVARFSDRKTAERRCAELLAALKVPTAKMLRQRAAPATPTDETTRRPAMCESLALDRTLLCVETGETWGNAFRMWRARPDWMTGAQVDRLTGQLYAAAKRGEAATVTVNDRSFRLLNVPGGAA
jgi:hypothetical protein